MVYPFHFLVSYPRKHLSGLGIKEIHGNIFTVTLCKPGKKGVVLLISLIRAEYQTLFLQ